MKKLIIFGLLFAFQIIGLKAQTPTPTPADPVAIEKARADRLQSRLNDFAKSKSC